jgi:hypothetical protein
MASCVEQRYEYQQWMLLCGLYGSRFGLRVIISRPGMTPGVATSL